jgi:hypothetical protein
MAYCRYAVARTYRVNDWLSVSFEGEGHAFDAYALTPDKDQNDMGPRENSIGPLHHASLYFGFARAVLG